MKELMKTIKNITLLLSSLFISCAAVAGTYDDVSVLKSTIYEYSSNVDQPNNMDLVDLNTTLQSKSKEQLQAELKTIILSKLLTFDNPNSMDCADLTTIVKNSSIESLESNLRNTIYLNELNSDLPLNGLDVQEINYHFNKRTLVDLLNV